MPSSRIEIVPHVINAVVGLKPRSILDVGIGFGKFGMLFREYLEVWDDTTSAKRLQRKNWQIQIDGVEVHPPYLSRLQRFIYNTIHVCDIRMLLPDLPDYDLIFFGDVIEHMPRPDGLALLKLAQGKAKHIIVTTPAYWNPQGAEYGNPHEAHESYWQREDFSDIPGAEYYLIDGQWGMAVISCIGEWSKTGCRLTRP